MQVSEEKTDFGSFFSELTFIELKLTKIKSREVDTFPNDPSGT